MSSFGYNVLGFGANASGSGGDPVDDNFNRVSFQSHFEGANNGVNNAFDDGSTGNHTLTAAGNATQGSFGPFARPEGYWSVAFDNSNNSLNYFALGANGSFDGNFTIEAFFNASSFTATGSRSPTVIAIGDPRLQIYIDSSSKFIALSQSTDQASQIVKSADNSISLNTWHHVAVVRSGSGSNNVSLYLDGTRVAQATNTDTLSGDGANSWIASSTSAAGQFGGHISNVRILKGTAQYSGSSITVPTSGLTNITNCVLLTAQSNSFVDNGANSLAILESGAMPSISAFGPFLTDAVYDPAVNGASGYFDSVEGTAIIIADDLSDFQFGTGAFTVEAWVYKQGGGSAVFTIHQTPVASGMYLSFGGSLKFNWGSYGNGDNADNAIATARSLNEWNHVAVVRTNTGSDGLKIYVNGVLDGTFTDTSNYDDTPYAPRIGGFDQGGSRTGNDIKGYITDVRIVKGTAVYTGNFTPPTAPLTAITNTKLLVNMADGQAIDSAAQHNLQFFGNTKISTTQAKFGDTSIFFDGTDDFAILSNSEQAGNLGSGDWTIEGWLFITANAGTGNDEFAVASKWGGGSTRSWLARIVDGNKLTFWYINASGTQVELTSDSRVLSLNTWYHVAWVKNSNLKVYLNGVAATLASSDFEIRSGTDAVQLSGRGGADGDDNMYQGYIDDFRISKFARYTADFTAPTAPFEDKGQ